MINKEDLRKTMPYDKESLKAECAKIFWENLEKNLLEAARISHTQFECTYMAESRMLGMKPEEVTNKLIELGYDVTYNKPCIAYESWYDLDEEQMTNSYHQWIINWEK